MTHEQAIAKVAKLLRLSESSNPHEAALAASKAQEILDRYKIDRLAINIDGNANAPEELIKDFGFDPLDSSSIAATWRVRLACSLAARNQSKVYSHGGALCLIGRASDVSAVRYMYGYLTREVDRLTKRDCAGCGRTYANNYRLGVVDTIARRLAAQERETEEQMQREAQAESSERALAIVSAITIRRNQIQAVEEYAKTNMNLRSARASSFRSDYSARAAGQKAGQEIGLRPASSRLSGCNPTLGR